MDRSEIAITALGKGLFRAECAPDATPTTGMPTTRAELAALFERVRRGEDPLAEIAEPRDLFAEMQSALSAPENRELCRGEAPHVLYYAVADERAGGATLREPLTPETRAALEGNASRAFRVRAELEQAADGGLPTRAGTNR